MFLACSCSLMHDIKPHAPLTFHGTWVYSDTELDTIISWAIMYSQHTFNTFVGGKLLGPTFLGSPTLRTVGVGVTFSLLLWKFC